MKTVTEVMKFNNKETNLKASFTEALKDDEFKEFVSKIKLPVEELMKYTTLLEESKTEYNKCLNCKGLMECKNLVRGHAYLPKLENKKLKFNYKPCKYQKKYEKELSYLKNIYTFNIPDTIKKAEMKNIYKKDPSRFEVIRWLTEFIDNYKENQNQKGLFLHGTFGSGKTYLITAALNELAKEGYKSAIVFWSEYLVELKSNFNKYDSDFLELINKVKKSPILLIDDIGAENMTPWARDDVLCPILQYRMDNNLTTFITTNFDKEGLEKYLSIGGNDEVKARRIIERINNLTIEIELTSKSLRN